MTAGSETTAGENTESGPFLCSDDSIAGDGAASAVNFLKNGL